MMKNAKDWEEERKQRVETNRLRDEKIDEQEKEERMLASKKREAMGFSDKNTTGIDFIKDLQKSTFLSANSSAADMVKRKRTFAQREGEIYDKH